MLFVRLFGLCLFRFVGFLFLLGVWEGLRFVIVALPGLFSYHFTVCCFMVYSTRRYVLCLTVCYFVLVFFSPFSIAITSLGEERANNSAFRTFVRFFVIVWHFRKGCGL